MAFPTAVNDQITDALTQQALTVCGSSPAAAMAALYQAAAQASALALQNAVLAQQQLNVVSQAATTQGVALLYSVDPAAVAEASRNL